MQPLERARLNYKRMQIISACDRKQGNGARLTGMIDATLNVLRHWIAVPVEPIHRKQSSSHDTNNQYTSFGSHLRWNLGGATGKNGSTWRSRPTIVRTHACIKHSLRAQNHETTREQKEFRSEKCDGQNLRRKLWETGGSGEQKPLLTSQPNCAVSTCTRLKNYVMTWDMKCQCIAWSATERHTAITIIWALRHGFGYHCTISHIKCGHPGAEDRLFLCIHKL